MRINNYLNKKQIMEKYSISERHFFNKIKESKSKYLDDKLNKNKGFWLVRKDICDEVFGRIRKPKQNDDITKWVNYVRNEKWDLFCHIRGKNLTLKQNKEIIKHLFQRLKQLYPGKPITVFSTLEENDDTKQFYHLHFLIKIDLNNNELRELNKFIYNNYPSSKIERYNYVKEQNKGIDYILEEKGKETYKYNYITLSTRKKHKANE